MADGHSLWPMASTPGRWASSWFPELFMLGIGELHHLRSLPRWSILAKSRLSACRVFEHLLIELYFTLFEFLIYLSSCTHAYLVLSCLCTFAYRVISRFTAWLLRCEYSVFKITHFAKHVTGMKQPFYSKDVAFVNFLCIALQGITPQCERNWTYFEHWVFAS